MQWLADSSAKHYITTKSAWACVCARSSALHCRYSLWQIKSAVHYIKGQILQLHFELLWVRWPNLTSFWAFFDNFWLFSDSPAAFRTLPRGMYQAVNPLKDYGYPSDYGLPMASLASNNSCYITSNPLSEMEMEEEMALGGRQQPHPQVTSNSWWGNCLVSTLLFS